MEIISINEHIICYENFKYLENLDLKNYIDEKKYTPLLKNLQESCIIVLWWDGSMLSAIRDFAYLQKPFLWINFWHKWFLLNDWEYIENSVFEIKKYPLLEFELTTKDTTKTWYAFNEIDIRAGNGRIITLEITLHGKKSICIAGDWIIISTPAGSTGYNNSLGWPIIPHEIEAFVITSKAPFHPKWQNPILFSQKEILKIRNIGRKNTLQIYSDSNLVYEGTWESVQIVSKKSPKEITLLVSWEYLEKWEEKVLLEQWFIA